MHHYFNLSFKQLLSGILLLLLGVTACNEIFEIDISETPVVLLSPADSSASRKLAQTFSWKAVEGARTYRLEIGSPTLSSPSGFYKDTTISKASLRVQLQAGRFEWRVRALNAGYETTAMSRFIRIDSSSNLTEQEMLLLKPADGSLLGNSRVTFQWEALPMADKYVVKIQELGTSDTVLTASLTKILPTAAASYSWQVTAINATSKLISKQAFTFSVDLSSPEAPLLTTPENNANIPRTILVTNPLNLVWQRRASAVVRDSVYLFTVNQTLIAGFPRAVTGTSYQVDNATTSLGQGTYYWEVKSVATSGRTSGASERRRFTVY